MNTFLKYHQYFMIQKKCAMVFNSDFKFQLSNFDGLTQLRPKNQVLINIKAFTFQVWDENNLVIENSLTEELKPLVLTGNSGSEVRYKLVCIRESFDFTKILLHYVAGFFMESANAYDWRQSLLATLNLSDLSLSEYEHFSALGQDIHYDGIHNNYISNYHGNNNICRINANTLDHVATINNVGPFRQFYIDKKRSIILGFNRSNKLAVYSLFNFILSREISILLKYKSHHYNFFYDEERGLVIFVYKDKYIEIYNIWGEKQGEFGLNIDSKNEHPRIPYLQSKSYLLITNQASIDVYSLVSKIKVGEIKHDFLESNDHINEICVHNLKDEIYTVSSNSLINKFTLK